MQRLHATQDAVECADRREDMWPLIEHDAVRTLRLRRVSYFRARRQSLLRFLFEHLGGPHDGHSRGFANPQDFLLQFGKARPSTFHSQVAAGDHHGYGIASHCGQHDLGESLEALVGFDLDDETEMIGR